MNGARRRFAAMNTNRHYGMDWLRIGAFALLIFYHIGMYFVPWGWHVKTPHPMDWVQIPMMATNSWRLPLLFLVSGYASAALFAKLGGVGPFLRSRSARLLIPLRSEEHTSELQSLLRISYAVFCLKKTKQTEQTN